MVKNWNFLEEWLWNVSYLGKTPTVGWRFPQARPMRQTWLTWVFWGTGRTTEANECWVCPWGGVWGAPIIHCASFTESQASCKVIGNFQTPNAEVLLFQQGFKFVPSLCGELPGASRWVLGQARQGTPLTQLGSACGHCWQWGLLEAAPGSSREKDFHISMLPTAFFFQHLCKTNTETGLRPGIRTHLSILAAGYPTLISSCAFCMEVSLSITFQVKLTICFSLCVCAILCACRHSSGRLWGVPGECKRIELWQRDGEKTVKHLAIFIWLATDFGQDVEALVCCLCAQILTVRDDGEIHKLGDWNAGANIASLDILFQVTQVKKGQSTSADHTTGWTTECKYRCWTYSSC